MDKVSSPLYAHAHNRLLDYLRQQVKPGGRLPIQSELSRICGASRTTTHRVLGSLEKGKILSKDGARFRLVRAPLKKDFLPCPAVLSRRESVEQALLAMLLNRELRPGQRFSELSLAQKFSVTTGTIREALLHLSHIGVFSKTERQQWTVIDMDEGFVNDFMDMRVLMETFALERYFKGSKEQALKFEEVFRETETLFQQLPIDRSEFFRLDVELHKTILTGGGNRCLMKYFLYASFPIQLQYLNQELDQAFLRNALAEHLAILRPVIAGDAEGAVAALNHHLEVSRKIILGFSSVRE